MENDQIQTPKDVKVTTKGHQLQDFPIKISSHMIQGPNGQQIVLHSIPSVATTEQDSTSTNGCVFSKKSKTSAYRMRKLREKRKMQDPHYTAHESKRIVELRKKKRAQASDAELLALRQKQNCNRRVQRAKQQLRNKEDPN